MNAQETSCKSESSSSSNTAPSIFRPRRILNNPPRALTLENAECGITLYVGQEFELDLGSTEWRLRVRDEAILTADGNGAYRALASGVTKIYATGEAPKNESSLPVVPRKLLIEIPVTVL